MVYTRVYNNQTLAERGGCAILNTSVEADDTNNLLKDKAAKAVTRWQAKVASLIKGGIDAGEFKSDINVNQTALSIVALIEGGVMIAKVTDSHANMASVLTVVKSIIDQLRD
nr:TetR family transcriptional regulator C-terminal domain-containing protein [Mucilaginibacter sp. dw_454]